MHDFLQVGELRSQAKRLLGYRTSLVLVIGVNILLLARIPFSSAQPAQASHQRASHTMVASDLWVAPASSATEQPSEAVSPERDHGCLDTTTAAVSTAEEHIPQTTSLNSLAHPRSSASPKRADTGGEFAEVVGNDEQEKTIVRSIADANESPLAQPLQSPPVVWRSLVGQLAKHWSATASTASRSDLQQNTNENSLASEESLPRTPREDVAATSQTISPADRVTTFKAHAALVICNPVENSDSIFFLANSRVVELQPGEAHQFPPQPQHIQFHRGGSLGNVERTVSSGRYSFTVTNEGWDLVPAVFADIPKS